MIQLTEAQRKSTEIGFYSVPPMVEKLDICWGLGPLEVCATKSSDDRIDVEIKLAGVRIASGALTVGSSKVCAAANVELVKANLCVTADFPAKTVWVEGEVCTRRWDLSWDCNGFKTIMLSW